MSGSLTDNPVITKDFRAHMRGRRAFILMGGYVLLMMLVTTIALWLMWNSFCPQGILRQNAVFGKQLFIILNAFQTFFLAMIIPIVASCGISQEVEGKTMDSLALTRLSSLQITAGRTLSAFIYGLVLVVSSMPFSGLCLWLGGISPAEIIYAYLAVTAWALLLASSAVLWSSLFNRSIYAIVASLVFCLIYFVYSSGELYTAIARLPDMPLRWDTLVDIATSFNIESVIAGWAMLLSNPIGAPVGDMMNVSLLWLTVPTAVVGAVCTVLVSGIFVLLAASHLKYRHAKRTVAARLLMLIYPILLTAAQISVYATYGLAGKRAALWLEVIAISGAINMLPFAASLCVGEVRIKPGRSVLRYAFSLRSIFRPDLGGAVGFLVLWAAAAHWGSLLVCSTGQYSVALAAVPWLEFAKCGTVSMAVVFAMCGLGIFLSCACKHRGIALGLLAIPVGALVFGYMVGVVHAFGYGGASPPARLHDLSWPLMFWPPTVVKLIFNPSHTRWLPLWAGSAWWKCCLAYVSLGFVLLLVAATVLKRTGGVKEETS